MKLAVYEIFESIQGESSFAGLPFTFIRLAGCNLTCSWCDTAHAQQAGSESMTLSEIVNYVLSLRNKHVCVTGGEPLIQQGTTELLLALVREQLHVTLETNGSKSIKDIPASVHCIVDVKCPSSGMVLRNHFVQLYGLRRTDEVKFVVLDRADYVFARRVYQMFLKNFEGPVFISPVWGQLDASELAYWVLSDKMPFRIQLQLHKLLNIR